MIPIVLFLLSIALQLTAAIYALLLIRIAGRKLAWIAISFAMVLMSSRRIVTLVSLMKAGQAVRFNIQEIIALAISCLMLLGVLLIRDFFRSLYLAEAERGVAEASLRQAEARYRAIFENAVEGIFQTTPSGRFIDANPALARMLGYASARELMDCVTDIPQQLYPCPEHRAELSRLMQERGVVEAFETELYRKDGSSIWVSVNGRAVRDGSGAILYWEGIAEDITKRNKAEQELNRYKTHLETLVQERTAQLEQANVRLQEMDRLKSMFIASTSHELRTPLNAIIGFTGMTLQGLSGALNEEQRDNLARAYRSAKHLLALITDIIDISKIEAGKIGSFPEEFPLEELADEAIATVTPQLQEKGLSLERELPAGLSVYADRKRLLQCMVNLLSNAAKFTEKGRIVVAARESEASIDLSVTDSGIGIADGDLPSLFKPFERLESHLRVQAGGTGLGLYLTAKLVADILRGTISVQSREGVGSTFTLSLPRDVRLVPEPPDSGREGGGTP